MRITVYGSSLCADCRALYNTVKQVLDESSVQADLSYESSLTKAMQKGVVQLPALEIDGEIKALGHLGKKELRRILLPKA